MLRIEPSDTFSVRYDPSFFGLDRSLPAYRFENPAPDGPIEYLLTPDEAALIEAYRKGRFDE